jgi:hypothetical protein
MTKLISDDAFIARFKPMPNPLNRNAPIDFGDGGCLFEPFDSEGNNFVRNIAPTRVWTSLDNDGHLGLAGGHTSSIASATLSAKCRSKRARITRSISRTSNATGTRHEPRHQSHHARTCARIPGRPLAAFRKDDGRVMCCA